METKKDLVFITHCIYGGGAERVLTTLANYMYEKGYCVTIISRLYKKEHYPVADGINVKYVETASHLHFVREVRKILKVIRPANVIAFEYFYNLLAIIACIGIKTNLIISERNDPARVGAGLIKTPLRNFAYRYCNKLVCQTNDAKEFFPKYIQKKTVVILNPVKDKLPTRIICKREKSVVNFCRLNSQKNIPLLIESFKDFHKSHPDYILKIYGEGEEESYLKQYIKDSGMDECVELKPFCNNIHSVILKSRMFVSSSDYEGLSNSMIEAMAIGVPTISTDCPCGGARMVITSGINGIITPVKDKQAMADAMRRVADDDELCEKLSYNASKVRDNLSLDEIGLQWKSLLI